MTPLYKINTYDAFTCLADQCPDNCCHGWGIPLDDEALRRFADEKGAYGLWLRATIFGKEQKRFSPLSLRCPHLRSDGLCGMQRKKGAEYIAEVCREYPKIRINYGLAAEYLLDLSCIHAAALFLRSLTSQGLVPAGEDVSIEQYGDNDDLPYFERLRDSRDALIDSLRKAAAGGAQSFSGALGSADAGLLKLQEGLLKDADSADWDILKDSGAYGLFPLRIGQINDMMSSCFFEEWLKYSSPFLYSLCRLYYRRFDRLSYEDGQRELARLFDRHISSVPGRVELFSEYAISLLYRRYLLAYEDYSPHLRFSDMLCCLNLVLLFYLCRAEKYGTPEDFTVAHIISATEKRCFHNDYVLKDLHACLKKA